MVGPGTGLAPLRAFTQERAAVRRRFAARGVPVPKSGDLLFFGCRKEGEDYLYREEMEGWVADGDLRHLGVAFSRDTPAKEYVQDKIREAGRLVWEAFEAGGVVLVSGASEKMPNDVRKALVSVVAAHAPADEEAAEAYMKRVEAQRRYLQDTWS
ncbi:hypothetical protein T484DRAFT_1952311 [Baffinella frigidus]|nr:hypothetical protein T484DRAFT_1952311 [Cryptophyta sp. CCMP2293]